MRIFVSFLLAVALAWAQPADLVVTGRYVVTMNAQRAIVEDGAVAVKAGRIAAVGKREQILTDWQPARLIDRPGDIVMPGLINAHAHAAMSLLRGVADDLDLQDWLQKYIFPAEARLVSPDFVRWGTLLGCWEMMRGGITTYVDMYYFEDVVAEATKQAGLRGILGETIIGFPVADAKTPKDGLAYAEKFIQRFKGDSLITPAVAPHALYTNDKETLVACRRLANKYAVPLVIHVSETQTEVRDMTAKYGEDPVKVLNDWGVFNGPTIAAHMVWPQDGDIAILKAKGVGVAHCPSSNAKLASGVAPVVDLLTAGVPVGLGTDGPAGSNNDFDLFEEMDLAAKLQKVFRKDPKALNARQAVEMATIIGARAVGKETEIGSLEPGKLADLITVGLDAPHAMPLYNVYSALVYSLKASDVEDVVVNGIPVMVKAQPLLLSPDLIRRKAKEYQLKVSQVVNLK